MRRFSVDEYHRMIESGILTDEDKVELLDGYVVQKMPRNPPHDVTIQRLNKRFVRMVPPKWEVRIQSAVTLTQSEPEPDIAIVRGDDDTFVAHHPGPAEIGMLVEVSDSSLDRDQDEKAIIYARADIPFYWIVNLIDRRVEVYSAPSGPAAAPGYASRQIYGPNDAVPVVLDGTTIGTIPVQELLP
jgi:Uma2 family endonuclease